MKTELFGTYAAIKAGTRGVVIHLPAKYCKDNGIVPGTPIDLYTVNEDSSLIIVKPRETTT